MRKGNCLGCTTAKKTELTSVQDYGEIYVATIEI